MILGNTLKPNTNRRCINPQNLRTGEKIKNRTMETLIKNDGIDRKLCVKYFLRNCVKKNIGRFQLRISLRQGIS